MIFEVNSNRVDNFSLIMENIIKIVYLETIYVSYIWGKIKFLVFPRGKYSKKFHIHISIKPQSKTDIERNLLLVNHHNLCNS